MALVALDSQVAERPSAPRRVKQVLDAAEACFCRQGFHATSMAQIAAAAQMSVGHIYRYFPGKGDIITAILERDVAAAMEDFDAVQDDAGGAFTAFLVHWRVKVERMSERTCAVLWLEIMAEAARNPRAAQVVASARQTVAERLCALLQAARPGRWTPVEIAERVEILMLLTHAVAFKTITHPDCPPQQNVDQFVGYARQLFEQA